MLQMYQTDCLGLSQLHLMDFEGQGMIFLKYNSISYLYLQSDVEEV